MKESLKCKPQIESDVIDYQADSVVSKTVIDKASGTLTLFAFDEGQELKEHTELYDTVVYIFDGEAEITIDGKSMNMVEGDMVIIPANQPHTLRAVKPFKMILVMIIS
jgi:quercetin dioxygenase-like cupin family protein